MRAHFLDYGCAVGCTIATQDFRTTSALLSLDVDQVLDRDRNPAQRQSHVRFFCFRHRRSEIMLQIRADLIINSVDSLLQSLQRLSWRNFPPPEQIPQLDDTDRRQIALRHSTTLVTMKRLLAFRGALLNASAAVNQSRALSLRKTLKIGTACAAASTPSTFTSFNFSAYFKTSPSCF